ncbi:MAG TPA: GIY-YIG nuclease family protein [Candidatus Moranbacteria bacterium]|nr:GIY-YIG nuclease family protein [Candidatus Moranbacteria bacterium]
MITGYLYILKSLKDGKTYIGSTDDLKRRLAQHEKGKVESTKNRLPMELIYQENYNLLAEARYMERYYKSCAGRKKIREILKEKM